MRFTAVALLILIALLGLTGQARAQASAVTSGGAIGVSANIVFPPLTANGIRPLTFGVVIPGVATTVAPNSPSGGEWRLSGVKNRKSIEISFTLPPALTRSTGETIPLSFNGNYAALCEIDDSASCIVASYVEWNPVTTPTFRDTPERYRPGRKTYSFDSYSVYVGGVATPAAAQRAGTYTGSVVINLVVN